MGDYDPDRRNYRDADRRKDRSKHRQEEKKGPSNPKRERSTRSYKSALDAAFSQGKLGVLIDKLEPGAAKKRDPNKPTKAKLVKAVSEAVGPTEVSTAIDALLESQKLSRMDDDILVKTLDHRKAELVQEALELLLARHQEKPLRRTGVLKMKLADLVENHRIREVRIAAKSLLREL